MRTSWFKTAAAVAAAFTLTACGGGGGSASAPGPSDATATVGVLITDAPVGKWDEAIATITSVTLIGDDGQVQLFSGSQTLDLLKLADFSELFAVSDDVPPGRYSKIRLQLSDLVLNDINPDTGEVIDSEQPQLVGNGKIDLNPRNSFVLRGGDVIFIELDFDMEKSLKITETGNGKLIIRPVVFVDIRTERPQGRLSRVHGEITEIDPLTGDFRLCQTVYVSTRDDDEPNDAFGAEGRRCVTVSSDDDTGIFGEDGLPQAFEDLAVGEEATVIGRLRPLDDEEKDDDSSDDNSNDDSSNDDSSSDDDNHYFALDAYVVEEGPLGTFRRVLGTVASGVDPSTSRFDLDVAAGQGIATESALPVQLFEESRIFNRDGEELGRDDIVIDRIALADGVLLIGDDDVLRSPLVVLGDLAPSDAAAIEGTVVDVNTAAGTLLVNDGTMDRCVNAAGAEIFIVDDSDGFSSSRGDLDDLRAGQPVSVFGTENLDGCLIADTILAEAPAVNPL
jgi:hypothetical protein